jgi:lipopolysaccharide transport system permease protein/teichoic acid transport system permease protein
MKYMAQFYSFLSDIIKSRNLILELTKKEFQTRYLGSYLGIFWAFIQPTISVLIFWFVFEVGFKSVPVDNLPFILWLLPGMLPWFFISDSIASSTSSILDNSFLVKKVVFRVSILPIIKILSALYIHVFFILFLFFIFYVYGYMPTIYTLQVPYYVFAALVLLLGIAWLLSALVVFLRDIGQLVAMLLQFAFWLTPIFWSIKMIPPEYQPFIRLNPAYYIIEGYRSSFIYHQWFWEDMPLTLYYWAVTLIVFAAGAVVFKRLRPHFADVL